MRPAPEADGSAVLLAPNVKVRTETQHYVPSPPSWLVMGRFYLYLYAQNIRMCGPQSRSGPFEDDNKSCPCMYSLRFHSCACLNLRQGSELRHEPRASQILSQRATHSNAKFHFGIVLILLPLLFEDNIYVNGNRHALANKERCFCHE